MLTTGSGSVGQHMPVVRSVLQQQSPQRTLVPPAYKIGDVLLALLFERLVVGDAPTLSGWVRRVVWHSRWGRVTVFSRRATGAEGSSLATPPVAHAITLAVQDSGGWCDWSTADGPPPEVAIDQDGVVVGIVFSDSEPLVTYRSVGKGTHSPPTPLHIPADCQSISISL